MQIIQSPEKLRKRTALFVAEGMKRGYTFYEVPESKRIKVEKDGKGFTFTGLPVAKHFTDTKEKKRFIHKDLKKKKMSECGLPVPKTYAVISHSELNTFNFSTLSLTFPCVVKPVDSSLSKNVFTDVNGLDEVKKLCLVIAGTKKDILIEEQVSGVDFRLLVVAGTFVGCVERRAANVVGDGLSTISELIAKKNTEPFRGKRDDIACTNHHLVVDDATREILKEKNLTLESILPKDVLLKLQKKIPASLGTDYIDVTEQVHESTVEMCERFSNEHGIFISGYDIISSDISKPLSDVNGTFNEFNFRPYIDLNENCNIGTPRPASKVIWDALEAAPDKYFSSDFSFI